MVIYTEDLPVDLYVTEHGCGSQENLHSDHWCICSRPFGHGKGHHCEHCGLWWQTGDAVKIANETPDSLNKRRLAAIEPRKREQPWFRDQDLVEVPRRNDMFVLASHVQATMNISMAAGCTITLKWMGLEPCPPEDYDETEIAEATDADRETWPDRPVQRSCTGVAVMDVIDAYPLGWAYIAHPSFPTVRAVSLDVITDIHLEL